MNRRLFFSLITVFAFLTSSLLACQDEPSADPSVPTAISFSADELVFTTADAGSLPLTVTAPANPRFSGLPDWLSVTDGTFADYKVTLMFNVTENPSYADRSATITVQAQGAPYTTFKITQYGTGFIDPDLPDNNAVKRMQQLGLGWNLGNQLDAYVSSAGNSYLLPDETVWGNPKATQQTFDGVKEAGFTCVRIPVTWLRTIGPAPEYKIDKTWMARVTEVVEYAHKAGLQAIVNTHHDEDHDNGHWLNLKDAPGDPALNAQIKEEITAVWTQIANNFKDCGDWLMFEGFNELNDGGWGWSADFRKDPTRQCNVLNEWQQTFVDAVRATGGNNSTRWLGISTYAANPEFEKYLVMPSDPAGKLMLSVHFYDPSDYTIGEKQYSDWGHTGKSGKKAPGGDEDHVKQVFGNLFNKYVAKDIPVYVGEFGCSMRNRADSRAWAFYLYYLEYVSKAARTYGLPAIIWDNGGNEGYGREHHCYINHGTGQCTANSRMVIQTIVKGWCTNDPSYTLDTVFDSAPVI